MTGHRKLKSFRFGSTRGTDTIFAPQSKRMQKVGILGGGQLGRMLLQAAANYPVETFLMENDARMSGGTSMPSFYDGRYQEF